MAENIDVELHCIDSGTYGRELRKPICSAIEKLYRNRGTAYSIHDPITEFEYEMISTKDDSVAYPILDSYKMFVMDSRYHAFSDLQSLKAYTQSVSTQYDLIFGDNVQDLEFNSNFFANDRKIRSIVLACDIASSGSGVFSGCTNVDRVLMNSQSMMTTIPEMFFNGLSSLKEISIPTGIITIGDNCFSNCTSLRTVDIPRTTYTISESAFEGCHNINFVVHNSEGSVSGFPWGSEDSTINWVD